jgi:hypothetical protein
MGMNRIRNKLNRCYTKYLLKTHQDIFVHNDTSIRYLFVPRKGAKTIVVVFSGMNPSRASYHYLDALNGLNCHRLYVLDDIGDPVLGCYYLGTDGNNQVEIAVKKLVDDICYKVPDCQLIFCGSSKGGYAAINMGMDYPNSIMIAGAPQYKLGYYLTHRKSPELLNVVMGETYTQSDIDVLDAKIQRKINHSGSMHGGKIYLHYSNKEHTFEEHIQYLLADLDKVRFPCFEDRADYSEHNDVAIYFPVYLIKTLRMLLG